MYGENVFQHTGTKRDNHKLSDYSFIKQDNTNQTIMVAEKGYNSILRKGLLSFHTHELLAMKQTVQTQFLKVHIHIQKMCT